MLLANVIVMLVLILIIGSAVFYLLRAKKKGVKCIGCPSGGSCKAGGRMPRKKLENPVIGKKTLEISGMHCEHCVWKVALVLNRLDGVCAEVNLAKGRAVVSYDREVTDSILKETVEKAGYHVTTIS